eukprot:SAG25_NODE_6023_length_595_cov_5.453629_1_plen_82_part_10
MSIYIICVCVFFFLLLPLSKILVSLPAAAGRPECDGFWCRFPSWGLSARDWALASSCGCGCGWLLLPAVCEVLLVWLLVFLA